MPPPKSSEILFWHGRYLRQAGWTRSLRLHLYRKTGLAGRRRVLDLGCGTGALAAEISGRCGAAVFGLDRDPEALAFAAREHGPAASWALGEAAALPFSGESFDLVVTHYFWMWVKEPEKVLAECLRVLEPGGCLLSLAEPDYSRGRDTPPQLTTIREQLTEHLVSEGADPSAGSKIDKLFKQAGLKTEAGVLARGWGPEEHRREFRHEWAYVEKVLKGRKDLKGSKELERKAIGRGVRRSAMPVHWAVGRKP